MDSKNLCFPEENIAKLTVKILVLSFIYVFSGGYLYASEEKSISSIGVQSYYHNYKEPGVMEQTGPFIGITGKIAFKGSYYFGLEGNISVGVLDYNTDQYGPMDTKSDIRFEIRGITGSITKARNNTEILSYTGVAVRFFSDDASYRSQYNNNIDYNRESTHFYIPFGISYTKDLSKNWSFHTNMEYDYFIYGYHKTMFGNINGMEDVDNDQEDGYGYRFSIGLTKKTEVKNYNLKLFFVYWDIDKSDINTDNKGISYYVPENNTTEIGLNFSLIF